MASIDDELEAIERAAAGGPSINYGMSTPTPINSPASIAVKSVHPVTSSSSAPTSGRGRSRGRGRGPRKGSMCGAPPPGSYGDMLPPPTRSSYDDGDDAFDEDGLLVGFPTSRGENGSDDDVDGAPRSYKPGAGSAPTMRPGGGAATTTVMRPGGDSSGSAQSMRPGAPPTMAMRPGGYDDLDMPPVRVMRPGGAPTTAMRPGGNLAAPQTMRPGDNGVPVMSPGGPPQTMRPGGPPTMKPSLAKDDMYYKAHTSSYIHANTPPDMRPEFTRAQSSRPATSIDHPAPPVHLPHENKIVVPRSESTNMSGDKYVAEMLKQRFEQEQQAKRTGNIEDLADDELNDFDDAIHLGHMPKNMGTGTPAAHRPLVGGFAAAAYEAARAYHFQHQGAEIRRSSKQDRKPPPSI